jgi:integrase
MAVINIPYLKAYKDRHGRMRYYLRRPGHKSAALPDPSSEEFRVAYNLAMGALNDTPTSLKEPARSTGALIAEYYRSAGFLALRASTQHGYRQMLEPFRNKHGALPVAGLKATHLNIIFHQMASTPAMAQNLRKRLRSVLGLGKSLGWIANNPVDDTTPLKRKSDGFTAWSDDDIAAFENRWPSGSRERLALALLLYTGVRRSDVVAMGRQNIKDGRIAITQLKTGLAIRIPIHNALQAEIEAAPLGMTFLVTQYGKPFTPAGFTQWFVERAKDAGLSGLSPHGLRKAAGRRLAEAGCSAKEIAAILGHSSLAMVETYTRSADQERLADAGMARLTKTEW